MVSSAHKDYKLVGSQLLLSPLTQLLSAFQKSINNLAVVPCLSLFVHFVGLYLLGSFTLTLIGL